MCTTKLIIGLSGASGIIYGIRILEILNHLAIETHLIISRAAILTNAYETNTTLNHIKNLAHQYYNNNDIAANIASGSFKTDGMIIAPCSMKTLAEIAHGISGSLIARAADVTLKERRKLILVPREAPLHAAHLENMLKITNMGGIIFPPVPAFYHKPQTIKQLIDETSSRILALFDIKTSYLQPWQK